MVQNRILTSVAALCVSSAAAFGDGYTPPPVTPIVEPVASPWQGVFYGIHAGYAATEMNVARPGPPGPPPIAVNNDPEGFISGGHVGYNFQSGRMVYGVIGDFTWMDVNDENSNPRPPGPPSRWRSEMDWMLSVRGRVGFLASDSALIYGHAGFAYGKFEVEEVGGNGPWAGLNSSDAELGYILGLGGEAMVSEKISVFAEYSFAQFNDIPSIAPAGPPGTISFDNDPLHMLKVGLNFRF